MKKIDLRNYTKLLDIENRDSELCETLSMELWGVSDIDRQISELSENSSIKSSRVLFEKYSWPLYNGGYVEKVQDLCQNKTDMKEILINAHASYISSVLNKNLETIAQNSVISYINSVQLPIEDEQIDDIEINTMLSKNRFDYVEDILFEFLQEQAIDVFYELVDNGEYRVKEIDKLLEADITNKTSAEINEKINIFYKNNDFDDLSLTLDSYNENTILKTIVLAILQF